MKQPQSDANATIQLDRALDKLDEIQLDDVDGSPGAPGAPEPHEDLLPRARLTPPPLPPGAVESFRPSARFEAPPQRRSGKTMALGVIFVALLGAAIVGGLRMGNALRAAPPVAAAPIAPTPVTAAPAPTQAPPQSGAVITMPTVEMTDPPAETK